MSLTATPPDYQSPHSAQELLGRHGINFINTSRGKYTTSCPECSGGGYLNVTLNRDDVAWYCHNCGKGGRERYEQQHESELGPIKAIYNYTDEGGKLLFQALRFEPLNAPKQFRQRTDPNQEKWSIKGVRIVPYRLPELIEDIAAEHVIYVVEGEKDVEVLRQHRILATCNPMGAGKWWPEFNDILRGADVVLCGDHDQPGRSHVELVAGNLHGIAGRLRVLDLAKIWPGIEEGNDISDWLKAGGTVEQLNAAAEALPDWQPDEATAQTETNTDLLRGFAFLNEAPAAPQAMLIEDVLPLEGLPFIGGQSSAGKTFIAILMAACAATQKPFFGHEVTERVGSVIVAAEGKAMLRSRILAALKELGVDAETEVPIAWVKEIPDFSNKHSLAAFIKRLQAISDHFKEKFGVRLGLVFVDTVSASFDLEEEADNAEASRVCKIMRRVSEAAEAVVVPIHHYGKNAAVGLRGASAWRANADIVLSVTADIDSMTGSVSNRQLSMAKDRDGAQGPLTAFMLKPVELGIDDDGKPFGSMVAVASENIQTASQWPDHLRILRQALSTAIIEHGKVERPYSDGPHIRAVAEAMVRAEFERIAHVDSPPEKRQAALRKQFSRKLNGAQAKGLVGLLISPDGHGLVWFASGKEGSEGGSGHQNKSLGAGLVSGDGQKNGQ